MDILLYPVRYRTVLASRRQQQASNSQHGARLQPAMPCRACLANERATDGRQYNQHVALDLIRTDFYKFYSVFVSIDYNHISLNNQLSEYSWLPNW